MKVINGAKIKIIMFALLGKIVSFVNNFKPSAKGCNKPYIPTTLEPRRYCIDAITFLSIKVRYATEINKGTIINKPDKILDKIKKKFIN